MLKGVRTRGGGGERWSRGKVEGSKVTILRSSSMGGKGWVGKAGSCVRKWKKSGWPWKVTKKAILSSLDGKLE